MSLLYILSTMLREEELIERPNVIQIFEIKRIFRDAYIQVRVKKPIHHIFLLK